MKSDDFFDVFENSPMNCGTYLVLAVYDIANNKRRHKISHILDSYGMRVQESAFECYLTKSQIKKMKKEVLFYLHQDEDSFRIYRMNDNDVMDAYGVFSKTKQQCFVIV